MINFISELVSGIMYDKDLTYIIILIQKDWLNVKLNF